MGGLKPWTGAEQKRFGMRNQTRRDPKAVASAIAEHLEKSQVRVIAPSIGIPILARGRSSARPPAGRDRRRPLLQAAADALPALPDAAKRSTTRPDPPTPRAA